MKLQEFIISRRVLLEKFESNWKIQNKVNPDDWPMEMGEADWEEQFLMMECEE